MFPLTSGKMSKYGIFWSVFSRICTEYGDLLYIQFKCGKIRTRKTPYLHNSYPVIDLIMIFHCSLLTENVYSMFLLNELENIFTRKEFNYKKDNQ